MSKFDNAALIPAPLKTVNENEVVRANNKMKGKGALSFLGLAPYEYNKVAFINDPYINNSVYFYNGNISSFNLGSFGTNNNTSSQLPNVINLDDCVIYFKVSTVKSKAGSKYIGEMSGIITGISTSQILFPAAYGDGVSSIGFFNANEPVAGLGEWLYITDFKVFNRKKGTTSSRIEEYGATPFIPFIGSTVNIIKSSGAGELAKTISIQGTFDIAAFVLNLRSMPNGSIPVAWAALGNYVFAQRNQPSVFNGWKGANIYTHKSSLGNNIKIIGYGTIPPAVPSAVNNYLVDDYGHIVCADDQQYGLAFKSVDDIKAFFADWGLAATDNLDEAQNLAREFFPEVPPIGGGDVPPFVPDINVPTSGYETNPEIPQIPSFPDNTSDNIPEIIPNVSTLNAMGTFAINLLSLKAFFAWLLTSDFTQNISELFNDKLSALNDVKLYPFDIVAHDSAHAEQRDNITIANVSAPVQSYALQPNYNSWFSGGEINYLPYYGDYSDYISATYSLYIPYVGIIELPPSNVINCTLSVRYAVDLVSGKGTVIIRSNGVIIKMLPVMLGQSVPIIFSNSNQQQINNSLTGLSIASNVIGGIVNLATGNALGAVGNIANGIGAGVGNLATNQFKIGHTGSLSTDSSMLLSKSPFLIISRSVVAKYNSSYAIGKPTSVYGKISTFNGAGLIKARTNVIDSGYATEEEKQEIFALLNSGIII